MTAPSAEPPVWRHYAWAVTFALMLNVAVALGFGRYALGMLLPAMGASLPLSYAEMGFVSTGNFIGYTLGVLVAGWVVARWGERRAIGYGLAAVAVSMLGVAQAGGFYTVIAAYAVTGIAGGIANVTALGLVSHWYTRQLRGRAAGFQVVGSSFAIIFCGLALPQINLHVGPEGWRDGWILIGGISVIFALVCGLLIRNRPEDKGLAPAGDTDGDGLAAGRARGHPGRAVVAHLGTVYFLFGFTYAVYLTFVVTSLVDERHLSEVQAGRFWAFLGLISIMSGPLCGYLSDRFGRRIGLAFAFAVFCASYVTAAADFGETGLWASVILFGVVAWGIPAIMGAAVGDYAGPRNAVSVLGTITVAFAMGQVTGPALGGLLAEWTGSFAPGYAAIAVISAFSVVIALKLPPPRDATAVTQD